jgi:hypothetical protein
MVAGMAGGGVAAAAIADTWDHFRRDAVKAFPGLA